MKSLLVSILCVIATMSSAFVAANTLNKQEWSEDLHHDMTAMKHEAVADISQLNLAEIEARDERMVKRIKTEQSQLVSSNCQGEDAPKS
ncbi:methyl-accepting chemotaxis protein [Vibrio maritimus]|uniref:Methyl-accepting chemotaxis protein n=1 Tax=Vibrio maritimus TaxID=990268 RepID=A0A090SZV0_9VIBR|nr:methyl-accepting chemotaxis protein [Vibrio maritimus]